MKLIDKDKVVAEIERLISNGQVKLQESQEINDYENYIAWAEHIATCIKVLSLLDSIEVKDVDLEKEIKRFTMSKELYEADSVIKAVAEHFFKLGLKAQKGE